MKALLWLALAVGIIATVGWLIIQQYMRTSTPPYDCKELLERVHKHPRSKDQELVWMARDKTSMYVWPKGAVSGFTKAQELEKAKQWSEGPLAVVEQHRNLKEAREQAKQLGATSWEQFIFFGDQELVREIRRRL